jgi:hypothetical protein
MTRRLQITLTVCASLCTAAFPVGAQTLVAAAKPAPKPATSASAPVMRTPDGVPDLQGYWTNATVTPLERPKDLGTKAFFTPEEAAAYEKKQLAIPEPTGKGTYNDVHYNLSQFGLDKKQSIDHRSARWPASRHAP